MIENTNSDINESLCSSLKCSQMKPQRGQLLILPFPRLRAVTCPGGAGIQVDNHGNHC